MFLDKICLLPPDTFVAIKETNKLFQGDKLVLKIIIPQLRCTRIFFSRKMDMSMGRSRGVDKKHRIARNL